MAKRRLPKDDPTARLDAKAEQEHRQVVGKLIAQCPEAHKDHQFTKLRVRVERALLRDWSDLG